MSMESDETSRPPLTEPFAGPAEEEWSERERLRRAISGKATTSHMVDSEESEDSFGVEAGVSFGLVCVLLFLLVLVARIPELFPELAMLRLGLVTGVLALFAMLISPRSLEEKIPVHIKQVQYLLVLFGLSVATIPVGVWPGGSFAFVVDHYWKRILLFLLILFWCRSVQDMRLVMWVYCLAATLLVMSWLLGAAPISGIQDHNRFYVGAFDPNDTALLLSMVVPFLAYLIVHSRWMQKLVAVPMMVLLVGGIILTQSRGGFLSLLTAGGLILFRSPMRWIGKSSIVVVAALSFVLFADQSYWDRIEGIWNPKDDYDRSGGGRIDTWMTGLEVLASNPWGVGIRGFEISEGQSHQGQGKWFTAHNSYLQVAVELGIAGLIAFVLLLGQTLWELRLIRIQAGDEESMSVTPIEGNVLLAPPASNESAWRDVGPLASAVEISLWAFVVGGSFLSQAYSQFAYGILALGVAVIVLARRDGMAPESGGHTGNGTRLD
jgi:O-antigen ligase